MSDQRRIVPSETPSAWAACEVDSPSGLLLICSMASISTVLGRFARVVQHLHNLAAQRQSPHGAGATTGVRIAGLQCG